MNSKFLSIFSLLVWIEYSGGSLVQIKWESITGKIYRVEKSENLQDWTVVSDNINGNGSTNMAIDLLFVQPISKFYRVIEYSQ